MKGIAVKKNVKVKVLFREGEALRSMKGVLKSISPEFVELQTLTHDFFLVNSRDVIKIQALASGGDCDGECCI